jgi:hypothetical protein
MSNYKRKEVMDYLTRKPVTTQDIELARTRIQSLATRIEQPETDYQTEVQPDMVIPPQDVLPKNPEPVMPFAPGIPNPQDRILELADGGRANFKEAGLVSNESVKAGELLSYLKKYGIDIHPGNLSRASQQYGIKSPSSGKYILPSENEIPIIKDKVYRNIKSGTTVEGRKNFNERSKLVKELVASEKYNPSEIKDIIQKKYGFDMGNTIQKEINEQRKEGKIIPSARAGETSTNAKKLLNDLNLLDKNKKIKDILSNPEFDLKKDYPGIFKEAKNTLSLDDSKTNYRLASLLKSYSEEKLPANKNVINNSNEIYSSYLKDRPFGSLGSVLYRKQQVEPGVASQINEDPNFFSNTRKKISRLLPGENIYSTDELKNLISSYENKTGPYSLFVQGIKKDINLGKGRTIDKVINQTEKELQKLDPKDIDYLDKRETIKDKYNERVKEFTNKYNKDLKKGELPVRGLELSFDSPKNSLARYNELKKINPDLIEGVEDIYNKYNYSFKVDADIKTIPEALGFVKSPEGQNLMKKAASVNAARVYADPTGIGNFLETSLGQSLSKSAPNLLKTTAKLSAVTGTPINALLGVALYADEFKEQGLSDLETIAAGAYKGSTQDLLNFGDLIIRKLPVATYEKFVENKPFLESLLDKPEYFEFADKQIDKYASEKSIKDRIRNRAEYEVRKSVTPNVSDTEVPATISSEEVNNKITEILNSNPNLKKQYKQETTVTPEPKKDPSQNLMLGPIVFPKYTQEELNFARGGRVNFASGSDDPESDLYIPPLDEKEISGTNISKEVKEGIDGLYFRTREEQRPIPVDPMTGKPISSGGMRELKQVFSSLLSDTRPEAGYRKGNIDFYASKGINPFQGDTDFKYGASYTPEGNVGKFMIDKTPQYLGAGYNYQKDGLDFGITGLKDERGDKSIALRFGYNYATGGRASFKDGPKDPSKRRFIKGTGILGAVGIASNFIPDLFQMAKKAKVIPKKAPFINIVKPLGKTDTEFPEWFPTLVSRLRKEGEMKPIFKTEKTPITEEQYKIGMEKGEKNIYVNPRTEEYFRQNPNEFRYFKIKQTDDITGYEYTDKNLPDVKVVEVEGKEASVFFKNYYGADVEINYKSPGVMDEGSFYVKDYQPEAGSALDSAPDFEETLVKNIDEVLGGSSQLEKYATKSKTARYTKGDAIADEMEGRAQSELDRMKDEGLFDD